MPESISVGKELARRERAAFLNPLVRESFAEAEDNGESLALLRPKAITFKYKRLSDTELHDIRTKHAKLADQMSLFDATAEPLNPCPFEFKVDWIDQSGKHRSHTCDDWESVGAFFNFRGKYGEIEGLKILKDKYESDYFDRGLALAFSTHSKRNIHNDTQNQWLLVGLIRLDEYLQSDLFLGT